MATQPMPAAQPLKGAILCATAVLLFAGMDTITKALTERHEVPVIMAARYLGNLLLMAAIFATTQTRAMVSTQRTGLVLLRAASLASGSFCFASALQYMPVADMTAIYFFAPILLVIAAGALLGETVGRLGWFAVLLGFVGVLLIVRPGRGIEPVGILFGMGGVLCALVYQFLSRKLAATESTVALLFYTALVGSIVYGPTLPWFIEERTPPLLDMALLASLGLLGGAGHFMFTAAFRHAPASLIAPLNYLQLLWAGLLGWLVFGYVPDEVSLIGMATIAVSGLLVALKTRRPPAKRTV